MIFGGLALQVAEARARKKMRAVKKMDKIKKTAQSIAESNELDDMSKARAIARAYKTLKEEKKSKTLVISKYVVENQSSVVIDLYTALLAAISCTTHCDVPRSCIG